MTQNALINSKTEEMNKSRQKIYESVGRGISTWANMESLLVVIGSQLIPASLEKSGTIFYSIINFHTWIEIITELFPKSEKYKEAKSVWEKLPRKLQALNNTRVRLAHQSVRLSESEALTLRPNRLNNTKKSENLPTLGEAEIEEFTKSVISLMMTLRSLSENLEILDTLDTQQEKSA